MIKSKRILKVPQESFLRNKLRKETRLLAGSAKLLPPVSFEVLEQMADDLLKRLNISEEYIDFTIVLLGNESWRKTVEATPFNRRLLLLPQCLKDNSSCKGVFDELGLNCAGCKACPIDDILLKAEELGYATLVAEGTTVAIGLVEEGSIDAVIGVSCMPVLQRSFEPVSNAAVPVIGLPLMYDGCENTKIDIKWLLDEVKDFNPNPVFQPISTSGLKSKIEDFFTNGTIEKYFTGDGVTEKVAKEFMQIGGQRIRPLLAALAYQAYSNTEKDEILYPLSLIIECFHKASLIHDDIEDNADLRYNTETAHKKYGIPQAINAGDYLIGKGYKLLSELPVKGNLMVKGLQQISESHVKLTQGQGADIQFHSGRNKPNINETLQIFKHKTGEAIKVALLLGAILGEAEESELQILKHFSDLFGISYQIRDDLNEFREENQNEKIADFPFLTAMLNGQATEETFRSVSNFRKQILTHNLHTQAEAILDKHVQQCYAELDKLKNAKLRLSLYGILGKIFKPIGTNE
ncbi:polyprenyl synthetase family protein [uncultured Draconibacterium sp.]|uniref:polyprenyl synthetase family protein n=1 Tax=uncultured Draconibacterium sp. TaxID=1573823 RepID=UPI0032169D8A